MAQSRAPLRAALLVLALGLTAAFANVGFAANLAALGNAARSVRPGPFGALEFASEALAALPQWNQLLLRAAAESGAFDACVRDAKKCTTASQSLWRDVVRGAADRPRREQLDYINGAFNRYPYRSDQSLYGVSEHWASPAEFLARSGDCEDYAIAKYYVLKALGFHDRELRIVVLRDRIRGVGHAVLAAYIDDDVLILDNLSNAVLSHTLYQHYIPQYSLNESGRWLHVMPGDKALTD